MSLFSLSDQELIQVATPIMNNLMEGSTQRDWVKHTKDFTDAARNTLSEQELIRQCDAYQASHGDFSDRELMGVVRHPRYISFYWKQRMTKVAGEYMALLSLVEVDGVVRVIRCFVDLWEPKN